MLIIRKILYVLNIIFALLLLLSYTSAFVPQDIFTKVSLFGYMYPFLLAINIVFVIVWLFLKPKHILLSLIVIGIRFDYVGRLVNYSPKQEDGDLKLLTYNVHDFVHGREEGTYLGLNQLTDSIVNYIATMDADVVCLQDYDVNTTWKHGIHQQLTDSLDYTNFYYYNIKSIIADNVAIYSKFPIIDAGSVMEDSNEKECLIYADIKTKVGIVRVYNLHLKSYMLGAKEKSDYKEIVKGKISDTASKNIINKLLVANKYRAFQIRHIIKEIEKQQKPIIICGDFNDHPFSNTYKKFSKSFSDSFVAKGNGLGASYNGVFPAYRIDYIWYNKNRLECVGYSSQRLDFSDHYPIVSTFKIKRQ